MFYGPIFMILSRIRFFKMSEFASSTFLYFLKVVLLLFAFLKVLFIYSRFLHSVIIQGYQHF